MLFLDFSFLQNHLTQIVCLKDPLRLVLVADIVQPGLAIDTALGAVDCLKESLLDHVIHGLRADHLLALIRRVVLVNALAQLVRQLEDFHGGQLAQLDEGRLEVFVVRGDLVVHLDATVLQDRVQRFSLLSALTLTVEDREELECMDIDIGIILFEGVRCEQLGDDALRVLQGLPGRRVEHLGERVESDNILSLRITLLLHVLGHLDPPKHLFNADAHERQRLLELGDLVLVERDGVGRGQVLQLLNSRFLFLFLDLLLLLLFSARLSWHLSWHCISLDALLGESLALDVLDSAAILRGTACVSHSFVF